MIVTNYASGPPAHARAVWTRPFLLLLKGLGTRLVLVTLYYCHRIVELEPQELTRAGVFLIATILLGTEINYCTVALIHNNVNRRKLSWSKILSKTHLS
jgi:hypothetical protein